MLSAGSSPTGDGHTPSSLRHLKAANLNLPFSTPDHGATTCTFVHDNTDVLYCAS